MKTKDNISYMPQSHTFILLPNCALSPLPICSLCICKHRILVKCVCLCLEMHSVGREQSGGSPVQQEPASSNDPAVKGAATMTYRGDQHQLTPQNC